MEATDDVVSSNLSYVLHVKSKPETRNYSCQINVELKHSIASEKNKYLKQQKMILKDKHLKTVHVRYRWKL